MADEPKPKINNLIFKELIKRGYSLDGNTRIWNIADSKLWYLKPEQAQAFLDLERSPNYQEHIIQKEIDLMNNNIEEIDDWIDADKLNIIDLGCGDGKKAVILINSLKKNKKLRYCPVDISSYMVNKAIENVKGEDVEEVVEFQWNISDFENIENISALLRQGEFKKTLTLLLGNTLGNFEINELLYQIRSATKGGDFLLIGNGLDNRNPEEILKSYGTEKMNEFLIYVMYQLGFTADEVVLGTRFQNSRVEMYYTIQTDKTISFNEKTVEFKKGDQIVVAISYKYNKQDFISFLNLYFDEVMPKVSEDGSYILALCKK